MCVDIVAMCVGFVVRRTDVVVRCVCGRCSKVTVRCSEVCSSLQLSLYIQSHLDVVERCVWTL